MLFISSEKRLRPCWQRRAVTSGLSTRRHRAAGGNAGGPEISMTLIGNWCQFRSEPSNAAGIKRTTRVCSISCNSVMCNAGAGGERRAYFILFVIPISPPARRQSPWRHRARNGMPIYEKCMTALRRPIVMSMLSWREFRHARRTFRRMRRKRKISTRWRLGADIERARRGGVFYRPVLPRRGN